MHDRIPGIGWRDRKITFLETRVGQLLETRDSLIGKLRNSKIAFDEERAGRAADLATHRDAVECLSSEVDSLRSRLATAVEEHQRFTRPSFKSKLAHQVRAAEIARANNWHPGSPIAQVDYKLRNYSLAASLGIDTPEIYKVWNSPAEIDFSDLSVDEFVLKGDGGHSGVAVIPLTRTDAGWQTLTGREQLPDGRPSERMLRRLRQGGSPYFAEEFLHSDGEGIIPEDIKVYTAYGQILQVLVMRTAGVQVVNRNTFARKYFDPDGEDLGMILPDATYGPDIPRPPQWDDLLTVARRISIASGMPFLRVDLYATPRGPVLGELTSTPGGTQTYDLDHDAELGEAWNLAEVRLNHDLGRGRPAGTLFGKAPHTWWYPESDQASHPSAWPRTVADAEQWFTPLPAQVRDEQS